MHVCIYIYIHIRIYIHICVYACMCVCAYTYIMCIITTAKRAEDLSSTGLSIYTQATHAHAVGLLAHT